LQRRFSRVENFGVSFALASLDLLATKNSFRMDWDNYFLSVVSCQ
jgi:hypothetical protein